MLRSCFLSSFVEYYSVISEKKSKMCQPIRGRGGHLGFPFGPKTQTSKRTFRSYFLSSFVEFSSAVPEKSKMSQPIRGQGGHLVFLIGPKNTNLVEGIKLKLSHPAITGLLHGNCYSDNQWLLIICVCLARPIPVPWWLDFKFDLFIPSSNTRAN